MTSNKATQLTITIPDGAPPGSILSIPVRGRAETIKARVPEGLGPGSTLVLTQHEGSDEWIEESGSIGVAAHDLNQHGVVAGRDFNHDGIVDALKHGAAYVEPVVQSQSHPSPQQSSELDDGLIPNGPVAYTVRLNTTVGNIDIIVRPDWAPHGARRFLELARAGDLNDLAFYRSVKGCLAQFGLPTRRQWPPLPDDPSTGVPFLLGAVCFAAVGKNSRKSTLFICIGDMSHCFGQSPWETPIGAVAASSLDALDRIETIYGDIAECGGAGPDTGRINAEGNDYLRTNFPLLTYIRSATSLDWPPALETGRAATQVQGAPPTVVLQTPEVAHVAEKAVHLPIQTNASMNTNGPINVPVEIVTTSELNRSPGIEVPIEVCSGMQPSMVRRSRTSVRSSSSSRIVGSNSNPRSTSVGGVVRFRSNPGVIVAPQQSLEQKTHAHSHIFQGIPQVQPQGFQQLQPQGFQQMQPGFHHPGIAKPSNIGFTSPPQLVPPMSLLSLPGLGSPPPLLNWPMK